MLSSSHRIGRQPNRENSRNVPIETNAAQTLSGHTWPGPEKQVKRETSLFPSLATRTLKGTSAMRGPHTVSGRPSFAIVPDARLAACLGVGGVAGAASIAGGF